MVERRGRRLRLCAPASTKQRPTAINTARANATRRTNLICITNSLERCSRIPKIPLSGDAFKRRQDAYNLHLGFGSQVPNGREIGKKQDTTHESYTNEHEICSAYFVDRLICSPEPLRTAASENLRSSREQSS